MGTSQYPKHWQFGLVAAIGWLQQLIWDFDEVAAKSSGFYVGVPKPAEIVDVIDGFLSEDERIADWIVLLKRLRTDANDKILPVHRFGQERAHKMWMDLPLDERAKLMEYSNEQVKLLVNTLNETAWSSCQQAWFMEGFKTQWADEEVEYVRQTMEHHAEND